MAHWQNRNFLPLLNKFEQGLTLVEVLVVAPLIILLIGTVVGSMTVLTGQALERRETNIAIYDANSALSSIELDVSNSDQFLHATPALQSPQGSDDSTGIFEADTAIILKRQATNVTNNDYIFYSNENGCATETAIRDNDPFMLTYVYYLDEEDTLWKRTIWPDYDNGANPICGNRNDIRERPSCAIDPTGVCEIKDERILEDTSVFSIKYFENTGDADDADIDASAAGTAEAVDVAVEISRSVGGRAIDYTSSLRANKSTLN